MPSPAPDPHPGGPPGDQRGRQQAGVRGDRGMGTRGPTGPRVRRGHREGARWGPRRRPRAKAEVGIQPERPTRTSSWGARGGQRGILGGKAGSTPGTDTGLELEPRRACQAEWTEGVEKDVGLSVVRGRRSVFPGAHGGGHTRRCGVHVRRRPQRAKRVARGRVCGKHLWGRWLV